MGIEEPSELIDPLQLVALAVGAQAPVTIGQYHGRLDQALQALPASAWTPNRNQIDDSQFFPGEILAVNNAADAHRAIDQIVSEGEGTPVTPDGKGSPLTSSKTSRTTTASGRSSGTSCSSRTATRSASPGTGRSGWTGAAVYPAIPDPESHDFSADPPAAQQAQAACDQATPRWSMRCGEP